MTAAPSHADADGDGDRLPVRDLQRRLGNNGAEPLGDLDGFARHRLRQDQHELLAAVASEEVGRPDVVDDDVGDLSKHGVTAVVAEGVVDRLEAIDVDERHRERLVVARRALDLGEQHRQQRLAVRDAGEPIVRGPGLELQERSRCRVEGSGEPPLGWDARLPDDGGRVVGEGRFEHLCEPVQAPAHVAPRRERGGGHASQGGENDRAENPRAPEGVSARRQHEHHAGTKGDRQRGEKPESPGESEHVFLCGVRCVRRMRAPPPGGHGLIVTRCDRSPRRIHTKSPSGVRCSTRPVPSSRGSHAGWSPRPWAPRRVGRHDYHAVVPRSGRRL